MSIGRQAKPEGEKRARASRMRELRLALGFSTQEALANASPDARLERTYVVNAESGRNAVSTHDMQSRFAAALGVDVMDLASYLDGRLSKADVLARRERAPGEPTTSKEAFVHPVIALVAKAQRFDDEEAFTASVSIRGYLGTASLSEEQAFELLTKARMMRRDNERLLAPPAAGRVVRSTGGSALDELSGGRAGARTTPAKRAR